MPSEPHILIADDLSAMRKILAMCCRKLGYRTTLAEDGLGVLTHAFAKSYHLIITDFQMPRMNGVELCRHLRSHERHAHTPILMCSSSLRELDTAALREELGRIVFVSKPLNLLSLPRLIQASATAPLDYWPRESQRDATDSAELATRENPNG